MYKIRVLSAADVKQALPMAQAIEGMKEAFAQLSAGKADVPLRSRINVHKHEGTSLVMPAYLIDSDDLAVKFVSIFPRNAHKDRPVIYATVLILDAETGQPIALIEGSSLTAIRTGAGAGAATDLLARTDSQSAAIIGSGVQARTQLEAICTVRNIVNVRVYSPNRENSEKFARSMSGDGPIPESIDVVMNPIEAIDGADIICSATNSNKPVFPGEMLSPGSHINAIGSFTPTMQEVDVATIRRAYVVVDSLEAALHEAGDLLIPLKNKEIPQDHLKAELGEIVLGQKPGRISDRQITYFKSVGVAVQDAVAGRIAVENAIKLDLGSMISL